MATVPNEVQGRLSTLHSISGAQNYIGSPYYSNPTLRNFEPRVGFAWDPFHNGKNAVRGGFGMFDVLPLPYQIILLQQGAPFFQNGSVSNLPAGTFPGGAISLLGPSSLKASYVEQNPKRNYVMQWNFNVQHQITPSLTATVAYVGSHGVHMLFRDDDGNMVLPTLTPQGYLRPSPAGSGTKVNTNYGVVIPITWPGSALYDSLQVGIQKKMSHGVQLLSSYTWGKAIDNGSQTLAPDAFNNSLASLPWFDLKLTRAVSDFNIGRTLVISGMWDLPAPKLHSGPARWLTNGWEIGSIFTAHDGLPTTPQIAGDPLGEKMVTHMTFPIASPGVILSTQILRRTI